MKYRNARQESNPGPIGLEFSKLTAETTVRFYFVIIN